jgi:putative membrane protein
MLRDHRRLRRMLYVSVLTVGSALVAIGPAGAAEAHAPSPKVVARGGSVTLQTEDDAVTAADRNLLINVRLAGLWEIPAGQMAIKKGASPRVRQIGQMIASQHVRLDALNNAAAKKVGVELPNRPSAKQTRWLEEMSDAQGAKFDDIYVMRLRAAHGQIFPVIGVVRATTDNEVVRNLAQSANNFVLTHISLLESTGLVQYDELPKADPTATMTVAAKRNSQSGALASPVIWMILAMALIAGAVFTARMVRPESFGRRPSEDRQPGSDYPLGTRQIPVRSANSYYSQ